ncbi:MAG TPA: hypothetical protein VJP39_02800 [Gaiellaceae bacterium]|nr:hypothetical protein [Gaiellaceae bacterium]
MPEVWPRPEVFDRGSPVFAYWLAHAEGLDVEPLGAVVERVLVPAPLEPPYALVLRYPGTGRTRTIAADRIVGVNPGNASLLLAHRQRPQVAPHAFAALRVLVLVFWLAAEVVVATALWLAPRAWRLAVLLGQRGAERINSASLKARSSDWRALSRGSSKVS